VADWNKWIFGTWTWKRPLKSLLFIYCSVSFVACSFPAKFIFHPPSPSYGTDARNLVLLDPGPKQLACLYYPPSKNDAVLLWSHGNAEDLGLLEPILIDLHNQGFGVLAYDYPGYGQSAGTPGEKSCYRSELRAYRFLTEEQGIDPARIIALGQSVGSGPACWLAEHEEIGGLILIAPFLSAFRTVMAVPLLPGDIFKNLKRMPRIEEPLLVIHGAQDEIIPFAHGQRLFELHQGTKQFLEIPRAGHNDIWFHGSADMIRAIRTFAPQP
jgi:pimeloyl-ACP methyl ester carboxylesterase